MPEPIQRVIFRKWRDNGEIIAFFPDQPECHGLIGSYQHIGQHGPAAYPNNTVAATPTEYAKLLAELKQIGYRLRIVSRNVHRRDLP